jgi:hypothetical protein
LHNNLARKLIEINVLVPGTQAKAHITTLTFNHTAHVFEKNIVIGNAFESNGVIDFEAEDEDHKIHKISCDNVFEIEGMPLERLVGVYGLRVDGSPKNGGKKRGRKSKTDLANMS